MKQIRYLGDPVLRKKCREVKEITPEILKIVEEMKEIVEAHNGAGLAAPQIGYDIRIFLNTYSEILDEDGYPEILEDPEVYINPKITKFSKKTLIQPEGCLSIPGISADVERAYEIEIEYTTLNGKKVKRKEKKYRAKCLQHEMDHLDGILYFDHLPEEELQEIKPQLVALEVKTKRKLNTTIAPDKFSI